MPPTVRSSTKATFEGTGGTTLACTKPAGTVSGDYLAAIIIQDSDGFTSGNIASFTGDTADGYARIGTDPSWPASAPFGRVFAKFAGGSEPASYTFNIAANSSCVMALVCIQGVTDTVNPIRCNPSWGTAGSTVTSTAPASSGSPGTPVAGDLQLTAHTCQVTGTVTWTVPTGTPTMVEMQDADTAWVTAEFNYAVLTAGGNTVARAATHGSVTSSQRSGMTMVISSAAGGGGGPSGPPPGNFFPYLHHHERERAGELWTPPRGLHVPDRSGLLAAA